MYAIIIKADKQSNKLLLELARKLGASVFSINEDQFEDLYLGQIMEKTKTGDLVSREDIVDKLRANICEHLRETSANICEK